MTKETIENEVKMIIAEIIGKNAETLDSNASFAADLSYDSVRMLETVAVLERKYRIRIPEDYIPGIRNISNVIDIIWSIIQEKNA